MLVDGFGNIVVAFGEEEAYKVVDIHLKDIEKVRKRMPYWKVRRNDLYELKEIKNEDNSNQWNRRISNW